MGDYVIIVAGGKGLRMGSDMPKQFLPVGGIPVLMRTIRRFHDYDSTMSIVLVLPESQQEYWHGLCEKHSFDIPHIIVKGGATRFHSVKKRSVGHSRQCERSGWCTRRSTPVSLCRGHTPLLRHGKERRDGSAGYTCGGDLAPRK